MEHEALLRDVYAAFNARDVDAVIAALQSDVDWPNAIEGGRVAAATKCATTGAASSSRSTRASSCADSPSAGDGRVAVAVHQIVHALDGTLLADGEVTHVYSFRDGLVVRMEVIEPQA